MSRGWKKFIYGVFFLAVFGLIVWGFYEIVLKPTPTCFDQIKNQGEEDVDCGGPCLSCAIFHLKPLQASRPQFFALAGGQLAILAEIFNPNPGYTAADFSYQINLYGRPHRLLKTINGSSFIYDLTRKYIFGADSNLGKNVIEADVSLGKPTWKSTKEVTKPNLKVSSWTTEITPSGIQVSGRVFNGSILAASDLKILAFLKDKFGRFLFVAQTYVPRIESLQEGSFTVVFPRDNFLEQNTDSSKTDVFVNGKL